ncbi:hypothetical protein [Belnapia moabensis]|uniref:hypothetical protein n=1 Tax=Belnapia moabensis TaxID=365533 RepID=UPI0005B901BE|nr:hypothetical protein [Belnapia moabensis]
MAPSTSPDIHQALALVAKAVADGSLPILLDGSEETPWGDKEATPLARMDAESGEVLGEAALAVAFGAFAARGGDGGPIHTLVASIGLMAMLAGEEPDPPKEIASVLTDGDKVEVEIDRAGNLADEEFHKTQSSDDAIAALEARIVGTAITLAGCTLPKDEDGQEAVRVRAARYLARLSAGLLVMNQAIRAKAEASQPGLKAANSGQDTTLASK